MIYEYLNTKESEYRDFDPTRAITLFSRLREFIKLDSYKIHVLGTNGKGSVGRAISQSLAESGKSVLHFTSPHLFNFRERFFINNKVVSQGQLENAHLFLQQFDFINVSSYFEYATFLALVLGQECEYLVMEAGIGGEFDATSVLDYNASIYTKIGFDHKEMLGEDLESIARTKLKVMSGEVFLHFMDEEVRNIAQSIAQERNLDSNKVNLHFLEFKDIDEIKEYTKKFDLHFFLQENLALANLFLKSINIPLLTQRLNIRGRMERVAKNVWVDVGHNEMAAMNVKSIFQDKKFTLIFNSYREKEVEKILRLLKNNIEEIIILKVDNNKRIIDIKEIAKIITKLKLNYKIMEQDFTIDGKKLEIYTDRRYFVFGGFVVAGLFLSWHKKNFS